MRARGAIVRPCLTLTKRLSVVRVGFLGKNPRYNDFLHYILTLSRSVYKEVFSAETAVRHRSAIRNNLLEFVLITYLFACSFSNEREQERFGQWGGIGNEEP